MKTFERFWFNIESYRMWVISPTFLTISYNRYYVNRVYRNLIKRIFYIGVEVNVKIWYNYIIDNLRWGINMKTKLFVSIATSIIIIMKTLRICRVMADWK